MKKFILFFINCLLFTGIFSQLTIVIKDAETKQPLPFATAECFEKQWGRYADSAGKVIIPDSIWKNCELTFSYVGYSVKNIRLQSPVADIYLQKLPQLLNDILVKSCNEFEEKKLEIRKNKSNYSLAFTASNNGFAWATFVPNKTGRRGIIQTISYGAKRLYKDANSNAPVRLRFYERDIITRQPTNEISTENIIVVPGRFGWRTHNISKYKIAVPENGIVVAFEMYDAGPQYHFMYTHKMIDGSLRTVEHYGWNIDGITGDEIIGFTKNLGNSWGRFRNFKKTGAAPQVGINFKVCKN
jgi:hypothetical protein